MAKKTTLPAVVSKKKTLVAPPVTTKAAKVETKKRLASRTKAIAAGINVSQFEQDAAVVREPTQKDLEAVGALAKELKALYVRQAKGQVIMDQIGKDINVIELEKLPALLDAAGLKTLTLKDGSVIVVSKEYYPNIKAENQQAAFAWLRKHQFDIIKTKVAMAFGKGQDKMALEIMKLLKGKKVEFTAKEDIHAGTLKKFVNEQLEKGATLPPSIDVHTVSRAALKAPK